VDGDPATSWATADGPAAQFPHQVVLTFDRAVPVTGFVAMARQNERKRLGEIKDYVLEASRDGETWRRVAEGAFDATYRPQRIRLSETVEAGQLRLTALSSYDGGNVASLAEFAVLTGRR
jgi:hypothetical protein